MSALPLPVVTPLTPTEALRALRRDLSEQAAEWAALLASTPAEDALLIARREGQWLECAGWLRIADQYLARLRQPRRRALRRQEVSRG